MAKKSKAGTDVQQVQKQNQAAATNQAAAGQFTTEFANETDAQSVRQQNQKSQANKK